MLDQNYVYLESIKDHEKRVQFLKDIDVILSYYRW